MLINIQSDFNELSRRVKEGDQVRFYDSQMAYQKKDQSGTNPKLYPIGRVLSVYARISRYGGVDYLCDIKVQSRVSNAHFVSGVEKLSVRQSFSFEKR